MLTSKRYDANEIQRAVTAQVRHGRYPSSHIYHRAEASQAIVDVLAGVALYTQKQFFETANQTVRTS